LVAALLWWLVHRACYYAVAAPSTHTCAWVSSRAVDCIGTRYAREDEKAARAEKERLKAKRRLEKELARADRGSSADDESSSDSSDISIDPGEGLGELAVPNVMMQEKLMSIKGEKKRGVGDGGRLLIPADPAHVPALCLDWAAFRCPNAAGACVGRHYFVTRKERTLCVVCVCV